MMAKPLSAFCSQCGRPVLTVVSGYRVPGLLCRDCYGDQYYRRRGKSWQDFAYGQHDNILDMESDPDRMEVT